MAVPGSHGEALRKAVLWLSAERQDRPTTPLAELLDEAARRFDLTPLEAEFLLAEYRRSTAKD